MQFERILKTLRLEKQMHKGAKRSSEGNLSPRKKERRTVLNYESVSVGLAGEFAARDPYPASSPKTTHVRCGRERNMKEWEKKWDKQFDLLFKNNFFSTLI